MVERAAGAGGRTGPPLSFQRDASVIQGCAGGNRDRVSCAGGNRDLQTTCQITSEPTEAYSASSTRPRTTGLLQPQHSSVDSAGCQPIGSVPPTSQRDSRMQQVLLSPVIKDGSFSYSAIDHHHPPRLARNITLGDLRSTATRAASAAVASVVASTVDDKCFTKGIGNGEASTNASVGGKVVPRQGWQAGSAWGGRSRGGVENREVAGSSRRLMGGDASRLPFLETSTAWGGGREPAQNSQQQNSELSELGISFGVSSLRGHRPYMEDEYKVIPNLDPEEGSGELVGETRQEKHIEATHFFGVFDGHAGGRCSKALTQNLAQTVSHEPEFRLELPSAVRKGFLKTNAEFLRKAERLCANDGSTAITAFIRGKRLVVGNVGDSRAVLCSGGRATALSVDHKPNRPEERHRICALGGRVISRFGIPRVNGVLAVSRAFGDRNMKGFISAEPEIREWLLERDDRYLVLATDGVWDVMTSQEVCSVVESCAPDVGPQACSEIITAASIRKGSMDNTTAMVIDLRGLWDEDRMGAKTSTHQRYTTTAAASSPDSKRKQQQQQQLKALISSSNLPASSCLYGSGMGGGGGSDFCNNGGWDGCNTSNGKSTRARGDRHEQIRPSFSSMPWTLQTHHRSSPGEEGINPSLTQDGGDSKGPPIGKPGGVGSRSGVRRGTEGDHGRRKSWGGGEIVPTDAAATTARGGSTIGIQHKKQFRAFNGHNGAGRGEQSKQQQLTDGGRHQRLSDSTSLAPRAWRVNSPSRLGWSIAGGGGGGAVAGGSRGRGQGFAIPTSHRTGSTELALSVYGRGDGGGRESSSRSASPSSRRV